MATTSSYYARIDHAVCVIDGVSATIYCCICEKYFCETDNTNFHNVNPDLSSHLRLRLKQVPQKEIQKEPELIVSSPPPPPVDSSSSLSPVSVSPISLSPVSLSPSPLIPFLSSKNNVAGNQVKHEEAQNIGAGIAEGVKAFSKGVAEGIAGIVLEPVQGGIDDGPVGVLKGVVTGIGNVAVKPVRGTGELLSRTAEGLRNTPTAVFDREGQHKEQAEIKHIGDGIVAGTKSFGMGLFDGITGIVMDPVRGAEQEGVPGFFKGVGKGLVGVVCKPVAGAIDLVAKPIQGIANTPATIADKIVHKEVES